MISYNKVKSSHKKGHTMKKGIMEFFVFSLITTLSIIMLTNNVFANWFESGSFGRNTKYIGQFGIYENKDHGFAHMRIFATAYSQTTATIEVKAGVYKGSVTASAGATKDRLVRIEYSTPSFYYAGGRTN